MAKKKSLLEQYLEQNEKLSESRRRTREELEAVSKKLAEAKEKYEKLATEQALNGVDHGKELDSLDNEIQALSKKHRQLSTALKALEHGAISNRIKGEDVREEWNRVVLPKLVDELIMPKLEEVRRLKYEYCKAVMGAHEALEELNKEQMKYRQHFGPADSWRWKGFSYTDRNTAEKYFLVEKDIRAIYGHNPKMPDSLKDYKPEGETE